MTGIARLAVMAVAAIGLALALLPASAQDRAPLPGSLPAPGSLPPGIAPPALPPLELPPLELPPLVQPPLPEAVPSPAALQPELPRPSPGAIYGGEEAEVARIEWLAASDLQAAGDAALRASPPIELERDSRLRNADASRHRAASWEDLAAALEADAARNLARADAARAQAFAPDRSFEEQLEFRRQAAFWDEQAQADLSRAAGHEREAAQHVQEAERHLDAAEFLAGLVARLARVVERARQGQEMAEAQAATSGVAAPAEAAGAEREEAFGLSLQQVLGIWRPVVAPEHQMAIVTAAGEGRGATAMQLHSHDRVWEGEFFPRIRDVPPESREPLMRFEYRPRPEEMNPEIPDWARQAIAGELIWRILIDEVGSPAEPRLSMKFYRGRVKWTDGAERSASVVDDGPPRVFEARQDLILSASANAPSLLFVSFADGRSDPLIDQLDGIHRGTPLQVHVVMSSTSAIEAGSAIVVSVSSPSGGSTTMQLTRQSVTEDRRVIYGHSGYVTIGGDEAARDFPAFSASPRRIFGWITGTLGFEQEPGPRLPVLPANGDVVEFRYGDALQRIPVYASWVQRALARFEDQIDAMAATYGGILASPSAAALQPATGERLRMLTNLRLLLAAQELTDRHRVALAEAYLGEPMGAGLLHYGVAQFDEIDRRIRDEFLAGRINRSQFVAACGPRRGLAVAAGTGSGGAVTAGEALQRGVLEALGATRIAALGALARPGLAWVHPLELECVERVIVATSEGLLESSLEDYGRALLFGAYDGFAMASGADDIAIAVFGTDPFGVPVPAYSLPWWLSTLSLGLVAGDVVGTSLTLSRSGRDTGIWKAAVREPMAQSQGWREALNGRQVRKLLNSQPVTEGVGDASRTYRRHVDGTLDEIAGATAETLSDLPPSLDARQRRELALELLPPEEAVTRFGLQGADPFPDRVPKGLGRDAFGLDAAATTARQPVRIAGEVFDPLAPIPALDRVIPYYGRDAKLLSDTPMPAFCKQVDGEHACEAVSANFMFFRAEGVVLTEEFAHKEIARLFVQRRLREAGHSGVRGAAAEALSRRYVTEFLDGAYGITRGYDFQDIAAYAGVRGYEGHVFNPAQRGAITVAQIEHAMRQGFQIRVGLRHPLQESGGHAVVVHSVTRDTAKNLDRVTFFCPAQGGFLEMDAGIFQSWIANDYVRPDQVFGFPELVPTDYAVAYAIRKRGAPSP